MVLGFCLTAAADSNSQLGDTRTFRLSYNATVEGLPAGEQVRVWLPVPRTNAHQSVEELPWSLPGQARVAIEPQYGNKILYFETQVPPAGQLSFQTAYRITRYEVLGLMGKPNPEELTEAQRQLFLAPNRMVPLDGKPARLLHGLDLPSEPLALARVLYNRVDEHVTYDKSRSGYGHGDVNWVCDSRLGNCTDFHSLFLSFTRARGLPSCFEIGFPLPPERGRGEIAGYHCWAFFHAEGHGWVPVDISEADKHPDRKEYYFGNLTEDRVAFTVGRDLDLVPRQAGEPLNFFIYPYVETKGVPIPSVQIKPRIAYEDGA